jgi:hypothetical protein
MKSIGRLLLFVLALGPVAAAPAQAQATRQVTATLLPVQVQASKAGPSGLLWIRQGTGSAVDADKDIFLQFDLSGLPPGLQDSDMKRATLRLVAQTVVYQPGDDPDTGGTLISVKGQKARNDFSGVQGITSIVALSTLTRTNTVARQAAEELRKAIYQQYSSADKKISLRLFSESHKSSTLFYSTASFGDSQSNIPRLVIEYTLRPPALLDALAWAQYQRNPEHTGRNPWTPFQNPNGFTLLKIDMPRINGRSGSIADYPLIYQGNLYLVYTVPESNYLIALDFKGNELWRRDLGKGTIQRSPVISSEGRLYVVADDKIAGYDLNASGRLTSSYSLPGTLSDFTDLTVGNDGSLFAGVKENGVNFIYGFTPGLNPFLKSGPFGKGQDKISTVTVSADGQQIVAQTPGAAVIIDIVDPSRIQKVRLTYNTDNPWEYYHVPVAGPAGGVVVYSDFTSTANKGNVWGSKGARRLWSAAGTLIPQPVLGSNEIVYYIQGGALQGHQYDRLGSVAISKGDGLNTTSNLVMDGANNIYFWDNGNLQGYSPKGDPLFEKASFTGASGLEKERAADPETLPDARKANRSTVAAGPEQFIRLMLGADGTLWANNRSGAALYAFMPQYAMSDPVLTQTLQTQTAYRATGTLTVGKDVTVPAGTQVLFQAQKGISFPAGFAVAKGASILCRTGF